MHASAPVSFRQGLTEGLTASDGAISDSALASRAAPGVAAGGGAGEGVEEARLSASPPRSPRRGPCRVGVVLIRRLVVRVFMEKRARWGTPDACLAEWLRGDVGSANHLMHECSKANAGPHPTSSITEPHGRAEG